MAVMIPKSKEVDSKNHSGRRDQRPGRFLSRIQSNRYRR